MSSTGGLGIGGNAKISQKVPGSLGSKVIGWKAHIVVRDRVGKITDEEIIEDDISVNALAQLIQINILALSGQTVKTVSNSAQAISMGDVPSAPVVIAGLTGTAPAFTDYALGDGTTNTDYHTSATDFCQSATVNAISSNTFTVTGTITCNNSGGRTYKEIGLAGTVTHSSTAYYFLYAHDYLNSGTGYLVSQGGTLAITYTGTFT